MRQPAGGWAGKGACCTYHLCRRLELYLRPPVSLAHVVLEQFVPVVRQHLRASREIKVHLFGRKCEIKRDLLLRMRMHIRVGKESRTQGFSAANSSASFLSNWTGRPSSATAAVRSAGPDTPMDTAMSAIPVIAATGGVWCRMLNVFLRHGLPPGGPVSTGEAPCSS